jgi:4-hydroxy-tetrahydrodipicolinate reductase
MTALNIAVLGADGRMGASVIRALYDHELAQLHAAIGRTGLGEDSQSRIGLPESGVMMTNDLSAALKTCDVVIDFSVPTATIAAAEAMQDAKCQTLVSGTTGFSVEEDAALLQASAGLRLLRAGNFSPGVTALSVLVEQAAKALPNWDVEILDMHHNRKIDAPSGTALLLGEAAASGRETTLDAVRTPAREGVSDPRHSGEIGFAALRGGGVIGQHEVRIATDREMITLSHEAFDRSLFARGAVDAAIWAHAQPVGQYGMRDMLGL